MSESIDYSRVDFRKSRSLEYCKAAIEDVQARIRNIDAAKAECEVRRRGSPPQ